MRIEREIDCLCVRLDQDQIFRLLLLTIAWISIPSYNICNLLYLDVERTCPICQAVFTSVNGRNYHVKNNVCERRPHPIPEKSVSNRSCLPASTHVKRPLKQVPPFHILTPGDRFVTPFGIVEVVKDDRAIPTVKMLPADVTQQYRKYSRLRASDKRITMADIK